MNLGENERCLQYAQSLSKLIRCETVSLPGENSPDKFRAFHKLLEQSFPRLFEKLEVQDFQGSLLMRWVGKSRENPILLMSHHDVVAAEGNWTHEPFGGEIAEGCLWGRGTLDTKSSLWAMLQAAEELVVQNYVPSRDVWFESACNEETTGAGADTISTELQKQGIHFSLVLDEGGFILHDPIGGADHDFALIGVGEKGCADIKFIARSKGGHASMPPRNTPLVRLGRFMAAADSSGLFPAEMNEVTQELFRRFSPYMQFALGALFRNVQGFKPLITRLMPAFSDAGVAMLKTTLAFTMAQGSKSTNTLPQEAWVVGNMRYSHHQGQMASLAAAQKLAHRYDVEMQVLDPGFESEISDYHSAGFALVEKAVRAKFQDVEPVPYIMTGASDCRFFGRVSENCFRFSPFRITDQQLASIHGIDENIRISELAHGVDFYRYIIMEA